MRLYLKVMLQILLSSQVKVSCNRNLKSVGQRAAKLPAITPPPVAIRIICHQAKKNPVVGAAGVVVEVVVVEVVVDRECVMTSLGVHLHSFVHLVHSVCGVPISHQNFSIAGLEHSLDGCQHFVVAILFR